MSHLDNGFRSLALRRFPTTDDVNPLQAWEAADEYLLRQLGDTEVRSPVLVLNDTFSALSCVLAEHKPYSIGDSYISELATRENLHLNGINESSVKFLDSTAGYPQQPDVVLIKVPKTLILLGQQLCALHKVVTSDARIIAGAKARDIHTPTLELFGKVLGSAIITLAWRKARPINYTFNEPLLVDAPQTVGQKLEGTDWAIRNHANIFSRTGLDIDACFFMQYLPENLEGEIVDLSRNNGVIGLMLLDKNPQAKMVFVDKSPMVVASGRMNVEINTPEALDRCEFIINSALSGMESFRFNTVLYSPPFHQQRALTDNVVWEMFHHARCCLKISDELYVATNRRLDYFHKPKKIFDNCATTVINNKFVMLKTVKLRHRR